MEISNLLKNALQYLVDTGAQDKVTVEEHMGHKYAVGQGRAVPLDWGKPEPFVQPTKLCLRTLKGLVGVLKANIDGWDLTKLTLLAGTPKTVLLLGPIEGGERVRPRYANSTYEPADLLASGQRMKLMDFRLAVFASFLDTPERQRLLEDTAAFSYQSAVIREEGSDGAGYSVSDKRDQVAGSRKKIENPVYLLKPWKVFPEVGMQPEVSYLLRIEGGEDVDTKASLTDVSGDVWVPSAVEAVGLHLKKLCEEAEIPTPVIW